jgi:nitrate reductase assembly molybdenum cofactor insertion protein NarJ
MAAGVWDGIDKERVAKAMVTAYLSDEYLEALAAVNNAETPADLAAARVLIKDLMVLWREEAPEYAFVVDALYLFSEKIQLQLGETIL